MKGYAGDIEKATKANEDFRPLLYTGKNLQLVLTTLPPGCDIGEEVREDRDQFFPDRGGQGRRHHRRRDEPGRGAEQVRNAPHCAALSGGQRDLLRFAVIVPAGARHNVVDDGDGPLQLYTLYAPPEHRDGTVHREGAGRARSRGRPLGRRDARVSF